MAGQFAKTTKVTGCVYDATAKVMQPKSVYQHSRGQRVFAVSEMLGKRGAATGRGQCVIVLRNRLNGHHREASRIHGLLGLVMVAAGLTIMLALALSGDVRGWIVDTLFYA